MGLVLHGSYINGLSKKVLVWGKWVILIYVTECHSHPVSQLWISCKDCFTVLHNERGQERHGNYTNGLKEILMYSEQFGHFGTKMVWCPLQFESALRFFR